MGNSKKRYTRSQLERLTTYQLREICFQEKIVAGIANFLDHEAYTTAILRFRGANEDFLIKEYNSVGYDRLKVFIEANIGDESMPKKSIANPARLTVYKSLAIEPRDEYRVITQDKELAETNVLLVDEHNSLCGIFHLLQDDNEQDYFYLCMSAEMPIMVTNNKNYRLLYVDTETSEYLFTIYNGGGITKRYFDYYQVPLPNLEVKELETSRETLAIDFGTSNTTAGIYLSSESSSHFSEHDILNGRLKINDVNHVMFKNIASEQQEWCELLPTVVGGEDCSNHNDVKLQYGYEVIRHDNLTGGNDLSSTFYEIKRWINSFDLFEEVSDHKGNIANVRRSEIITNYIKYVIWHAEQQFKCRFKYLHISSPVKLKQQFITMFREILPEYELEEQNALDEGVAVLYNTIANLIQRKTFEKGLKYKALIIDCGGGTTDLSSCEFSIDETEFNYHIKINTTYENGDTNFGGNNLTYRIMQYLKILIANYYADKNKTVNFYDIMQVLVGDIYRYVDVRGKEALYEQLEAKYQASEALLPTQYSQYLHKSNNEFMLVKANYHTLWRLANEIKQRFFEDIGLMQINLVTDKLNALTNFKLSIVGANGLEYTYQRPDVNITLPELSGLIKGDIYYIINKFLGDLYHENKLHEFAVIKMTGQSCRIDLFRDSIKEFVPGRQVDFTQKENHVLDLKLSCLNGVLKYLHAKKTGRIRATIQNSTPITPYAIFAYNHKDEKHPLLSSATAITHGSGYIAKHCEIQEMVFYLENVDNQIQTSYLFLNNFLDYSNTTYDEMRAKHSTYITQDNIDTIVDDEVRFFVYATENNWGFYVLPVMRINGELKIGKEQYFPFENEQWELNFFDGKK